MEENAASNIARRWLSHLRASDERAPAIADTFQRVLPEARASAISEDNRLAVLADNEIYVVTAHLETDDVTKLQVECVQLSSERVRPSLSETHDSSNFGPRRTSYSWLIGLEGLAVPALEFNASAPLAYDLEGDGALDFWWGVAEARGWTKPH